MGYNIYYMYDIETGKGYIGQNTDDDDDDKRILDHYNAALKPKKNKKGKEAYDGGAEVVKNAKLSNVRYKFFKDKFYGISEKVYNAFLAEWSPYPDRQVSWNQLNQKEQLDLAEIMHNMWAHLHGNQWNIYNRIIGGMSYTKKNTDAMKSLTYHFDEKKIQEIVELYKKEGLELPNDYTVKRFSFKQIYLESKGVAHNDFAKLMYPLQHVVVKSLITQYFNKIISDYLNSYFKDIFESDRSGVLGKALRTNLGTLVTAETVETLSDPKMYSDLLKDLAGKNPKTKIKDMSYNLKNHTTNKKFVEDLIKALKLSKRKSSLIKLCNRLNYALSRVSHIVDVKWDYKINKDTLVQWINEIIDRISKLSITKLSKMFDYKYEKFHIDLSDIFTQTIPLQLHIQIKEKPSTLPKWAEELKKEQLLSRWTTAEDGKLKRLICENVCTELFSEIKNNIVPSQYDSSTTLQKRLYDLLHKDDWIKSGYSWDFCRTLIEVWHEYTYGYDAWTRKVDTSFYSEGMPNYEKYRFARKDIIEYAEQMKSSGVSFTIHWYRGTFYESSGIAKGSLQDAARVLAEKWRW